MSKKFIIVHVKEFKKEMLDNSGIRNLQTTSILLEDGTESDFIFFTISRAENKIFETFKKFDRVALAAAQNLIKKTGTIYNRRKSKLEQQLLRHSSVIKHSSTGTHSFNVVRGVSAFQDFIIRKNSKLSSVSFIAESSTTSDRIDLDILTLNDERIALPINRNYVLSGVNSVSFSPIALCAGHVIRITYYNNGASEIKLTANCMIENDKE